MELVGLALRETNYGGGGGGVETKIRKMSFEFSYLFGWPSGGLAWSPYNGIHNFEFCSKHLWTFGVRCCAPCHVPASLIEFDPRSLTCTMDVPGKHELSCQLPDSSVVSYILASRPAG